jgi:hypothetical protein
MVFGANAARFDCAHDRNTGTTVADVVVETNAVRKRGSRRADQDQWRDTAFDVQGADVAIHEEATLTADLPLPGTYRAFVVVREPRKEPLRAAIEVERVRAAVPIDVAAIPARMVSTIVPTEVSFTANVRSTGESVTLDTPELQSLTYSENAAGTNAHNAPSGTLEAGPTTHVGAAVAPLTVTVTDLRQPGRYDATVSLG